MLAFPSWRQSENKQKIYFTKQASALWDEIKSEKKEIQTNQLQKKNYIRDKKTCIQSKTKR